uniref:ND5 n=1 Tax=Euglena gracilis TaxID=3039 RepID=UPI002FE4FADE
MLIISIIKWLIISIIMNLSGNIIGINGLIYIIMLILVLSPIISWYVLYNIIIINIYNNKLIYLLSYNFINYYNYNIDLEIGISIYEMITVILLINVSYMINIYILKYLYKDKNVIRFVCIIMLFTYNMILLIISNDLIMLFIGWEMIGIISLLLINYYNNRIEATKAGLKAVVYNRIGDVFLLLSIILSINMYNSNSILLYNILISYMYYNINYININLIIGMSFIICAWSKSTQLGFQPWLLDAMEGPTPVSALLHSATLVTAGIILLYKNRYILYYNSSLAILLLILGGISCLLNSFSSINYLDIKRIVAYSTCTHISLMIMILGIDILINISEISLLHLFYHGWSKSLIFMLCGYMISIIHSQDLRFFGNLFQHIPILFVIINISLLTILGFPGSYLSYSKDIILEFGLISIYGYNIILLFIIIILLSQGYSLGILLYLIYNYSYYNSTHNIYNFYSNKNNYIYIFAFLYLIIIIIYLPFLLYDILIYNNISIMHHISYIDPFSLIAFLGFILSYYNYNYNHTLYIFNIHNNRLYIDKLLSSFMSIFSIHIIYYFQFILEYGFIMHYLHITNIIIFLIFLI